MESEPFSQSCVFACFHGYQIELFKKSSTFWQLFLKFCCQCPCCHGNKTTGGKVSCSIWKRSDERGFSPKECKWICETKRRHPGWKTKKCRKSAASDEAEEAQKVTNNVTSKRIKLQAARRRRRFIAVTTYRFSNVQCLFVSNQQETGSRWTQSTSRLNPVVFPYQNIVHMLELTRLNLRWRLCFRSVLKQQSTYLRCDCFDRVDSLRCAATFMTIQIF